MQSSWHMKMYWPLRFYCSFSTLEKLNESAFTALYTGTGHLGAGGSRWTSFSGVGIWLLYWARPGGTSWWGPKLRFVHCSTLLSLAWSSQKALHFCVTRIKNIADILIPVKVKSRGCLAGRLL